LPQPAALDLHRAGDERRRGAGRTLPGDGFDQGRAVPAACVACRGWPPAHEICRDAAMSFLPAFGVLIVVASARPADEPRPFPGAVSRWHGFVRHDFRVDGADVIVVEPQTPLPGRPWAWRGEFFG